MIENVIIKDNMKKVLLLLVFLVSCSKSVATAILPSPRCDYDYDLIAKTVYGEARGESFDGRKAIMDVIRNRMNNCRLSSKQVITRKGYNKVSKKYEYAFDGVNVEVNDKEVYERIRSEITLYLSLDDITDGATYFYSGLKEPYWTSNRQKIKTIGQHHFYR